MKKIPIIFLVIVSCMNIHAGPVKELIAKSGDAVKYPGNDELVIFDSTLVDMQESGLTYVVSHSLTKALNSKGALDLSVIKSGYDPLSAYIEFREVNIYKKDGTVVRLDMKNVMDYPAPARAIYWGAREKMIAAGRLEAGDAVEVVQFRKGFTYALLQGDDDKYIPPMRGHFYDIVEFFDHNPVSEKVYQVSIPRSKTLQFRFYNGEASVSSWIAKDKLVYTFTKTDMLPLKSEPRMVALSDIEPKLLLSTSPDWLTKSTWFYKVNEDFGSFESTPEIKAKVDEILKGAKNETDSVARLTHWCADEIRYSGISMGCGEGFTLHKGSMTFTDRCGVCKDKAGMLITMLRAAGFKSYPAMTMAGSRIDYIPADQFNHCVTVVKLHDGKYKLLDPTWVPFIRELWSSAEQQQQYLMGVPEGADLGTTPVSDPGNHYINIEGNTELLADGSLKGSFSIQAEGQSDAAVRGLLRNAPPALWSQNIEKEILKLWPQAVVAKTAYTDPAGYRENAEKISIEFLIPGYAVISGKTLLFTPLSAAEIFKNFQGQLSFETDPAERKYQFRDRCSREVNIHETMILPSNCHAGRVPASMDAGGKSVSYKGSYTVKGNTLEFTSKAVFTKRIYDPADWPEFRSSIEAQNKFSEKAVTIEL
jgi:transglutaminase-like putative cysteine protease